MTKKRSKNSDSTHFKLSNHGVFLAEELRSRYRSNTASDLKLEFPDGSVSLDRSVLATVSPFIDTLFSEIREDDSSVHIPDCSAVEGGHLTELLYTGATVISRENLGRLMDLTKTLKLSPIPVAAVEPGESPDERREVSLIINRLRPDIIKDKIIIDDEDLNNEEDYVTLNVSNDQEAMRILEKMYRKDPGLHPCPICGNKYKHASTLKNHMDVHRPEEIHLCDVCGKKFRTKDQCSSHRLLHGERKLGCNVCGATFKQRNVLRQHKVIHHEPKKFICQVCQKKFGTKQNLAAHRRTHTGEKPYDCELCSAKFNRAHHLQKHVASSIHAEKVVRTRKEGRAVPAHLDPDNNTKNHLLLKDSDKNCDLCPKSLRSEYLFQRHIRGWSHLQKMCQRTNMGVPISRRLIPPDMMTHSDEDQVDLNQIVIITEDGNLASVENAEWIN